MDRNWMYLSPRSSKLFLDGINNFLDLAFMKSATGGKILCPCFRCLNMFYLTREEVHNHLICNGFQKAYTQWIYHGEQSTTSANATLLSEEGARFDHDLDGLMQDLFPTMHAGESNSIMEGDEEAHVDDVNLNAEQADERTIFSDLLKDAEKKVYAGCKYTKLSCLVHLYHLKCLHGWSNKSFTMLLEFLKDLLPDKNEIPESTHAVKKIISNLGLGYEKIHVCPNSCMLFWKDKEDQDICSICGASRWKTSLEHVEGEQNSEKKKASNILRWFPLKPRLQRLYMSSKTASLMQWHHRDRMKDGKLRHPADAESFRNFDEKYPEFSCEPRNVRLFLASDGFNPFRTMNVAYSVWPVFIIPTNLPPWLVMKQPNFILSLIIPGPKSPGNKIDVYMQPLMNELKELWDDGIETYDASIKSNFLMKVALLGTISDFPAYANLSGWSTKGEYACPICGIDTGSKWLQNGRKFCYMFHRRWLPGNHAWRYNTSSFDGSEELRPAPVPLSGVQVLEEFKDIEYLDENLNRSQWKKKNILFMLHYWKDVTLHHSLDVMHIEKNVCDNVIGTILGQEGKSKDNYKARLDLQLMGIRSELHPQTHPRRKNIYLPKACYQMTKSEKDVFLHTLKSIKPPDEYSSNISRCVQLNDRKLIGMKSYDCHMLMQEFLPIAIRGTLPDHVTSLLFELSDFFKRICSKVLSVEDVQQTKFKVGLLLCKLEKIFPPSFFTVMVHLVIHLAREVRLGGPVTFRWMYPIERYLCTLKSYVHNRAHPEGSIAEGYMAQESITFCSRYLSGVETRFTRPIRNDDDDNQNEMEEANMLCPGRPLLVKVSKKSTWKRKRRSNYELDEKSLKQAHRYVLFNVDSIKPFQDEHKAIFRARLRSRRRSEYEIEKNHSQQFSDWFQKRVARLEIDGDARVTDDIKWLARGPNTSVKRYSGYLVKGYRFHTKDHERPLKTQNSGVVVIVRGDNYDSSRARRSVIRDINYYGSLTDIIQLNYSGKIRVVLFKCDWIDINRGCRQDEFGVTLVNFSYLAHTGIDILDDPFVLASQVEKVFYTKDTKCDGWLAVKHVKVRDAFDLGYEEEYEVQHIVDELYDVPNLQRIGVDGDDGEDVTPRMELDEVEDENEEIQ